jgi:hypothetical protein
MTMTQFPIIEYEQLTDSKIKSEIFEIIATADLFTSINKYTDSIELEIDKL